ncbi:hypothetical protein OAD66_01470 [Bacteroidia bacterium]|nr:hypothetical protein [Bacteroidia bacterium]MDB9881784.1 hypothetical protein [Bacteroidia bacterium]
MKYVIRVVLLALIAVLTYYTYESIAEPVRYEKEVAIKEEAVIEKLKTLRDGQIAYKDQNGKFSGDFNDLLNFMENGQMKVLIQQGDKDDSTTVYKVDEILVSVKDSLFKDIDVPNLRYVPFNDTLQFLIASGEIKKNNVTVPVFEIKDPAPFNRERSKKNDPLKVGSIFDVNYNGNWN